MSVSSSRYFWMPRRPAREQSVVGATAAAAVMFAAAVVISGKPSPHSAVGLAGLAGANEASAEEIDDTSELDQALRQLVVGRWKGYFHGERVVENRADGTATMDLKFDLIAGFLYGPTMSLELTWEVKAGELAYEIVSGEPEDRYKSMIASQGAKASYYFEEAGQRVMRLVRTIDPDEKYTWTRVE